MTKYRVAYIPGDGIGPEVIGATIPVLDAIQDVTKGFELEYVFAEAGVNCISKYGTNLPEKTKQILKESDCCLKGPLTTPEEPKAPQSATVQIRKMFDLYANIRPVKALPRVPTLNPKIDMIIVRENTEGLYSGIEFRIGTEAAIAIRLITKRGCERIVKYAFHLASQRRKEKLHASLEDCNACEWVGC